MASGLVSHRVLCAQAKKSVKFTLSWVAKDSNLFAFVARSMGLGQACARRQHRGGFG
jgi:hypothetical protein